jgi:hypothetical protein
VQSVSTTNWTFLPGLSANVPVASTNAVVITTDGGLLNFSTAGGQALVDMSIQDTFNGSTTVLAMRRYTLLNSAASGTFSAEQGWSLTIAPTLAAGTHLIRVAAAVVTVPSGNAVSISAGPGTVNTGTLTITTINK